MKKIILKAGAGGSFDRPAGDGVEIQAWDLEPLNLVAAFDAVIACRKRSWLEVDGVNYGGMHVLALRLFQPPSEMLYQIALQMCAAAEAGTLDQYLDLVDDEEDEDYEDDEDDLIDAA